MTEQIVSRSKLGEINRNAKIVLKEPILYKGKRCSVFKLWRFKKCKQCKKEFGIPFPKYILRNKMFHSPECATMWHNEKRKKDRLSKIGVTKCVECNKEIPKNRKNRRFCSTSCANMWNYWFRKGLREDKRDQGSI